MIKIRISQAIANEYGDRLPDHLPLDKLGVGAVELTLAEAQAVLADAEFNSNRRCVDVGPYAMPLRTFNAYRALAKQARVAIEESTK